MRLSQIDLTKWVIVAASVPATMAVVLYAPNSLNTAHVPNRLEIHDSAYYLKRVDVHARLERQSLAKSWALMKTPSGKRCVYSEGPTPLSEYHARLKRKYEQAALHPGLPVLADPPPPAP
jgi:hypothetical protein